MKQTLHWRLVWPNFVSQCCLYRVSLTVTKHLDFWPTFDKADVTSRFYLRTLFLGPKCWILTRHIQPMGIWFPIDKADVSWRCLPERSSLIPMRRVLRSRNSWTFSFILPYLSEMKFVDISLDCEVSQRPLCGTLVRLPWTLSLMFPYSRGWW